MKRDLRLFILPALAVIILDQATKMMIARYIDCQESITVIKGFFNIVHIRNRGIAFGMMSKYGVDLGYYLMVCAACVAIILLIYWFNKLRKENRFLIPGLSLILGGAIGNLIDRIRLKEVIDFLDFQFRSYHWFSFNIADSSITVGAIWVGIIIFFFDSRIKNQGKQ